MFLLNAYLDEHQGGLAGLQSVWLENEGLEWLTELERVYGLSAPALWADFTGAYFAGRLSDAEFCRPEPVDSPGTIEGELGSMYIQLEATDEVVLEDGEERWCGTGSGCHSLAKPPSPTERGTWSSW